MVENMAINNTFRPMLAENADVNLIRYPVLVTHKFDGVRLIVKEDKCLTRTGKELPNKYITKTLLEICNTDSGFYDGELIAGNFQETTSAVMSIDGEPVFTYNIFDYVTNVNKPYSERVKELSTIAENDIVKLVIPTVVNSHDELMRAMDNCINDGYEGVVFRSLYSPYKFGRSTVKEGHMLKLKRFKDSEAVIISIEELMHNTNEAKYDVLGYTDRSTCKDGMEPGHTMGALKVRNIKTNVEFSIGSGFTQAQRDEIWKNREKYINSIVKYKYQEEGEKDKPRFPVFIGFRSDLDI